MNINVDYIGVVSITNSGLLEYKHHPITKLYDEEMGLFKAMYDNENRSIMELQDYFCRFMPKNSSPQGYDYCFPYGYSESYITRALYPKIYSFEEYQAELKDVEDFETSKFLSEHNIKHLSMLTVEQKELLDKTLLDAKKRKREDLRYSFFKSANRFVQALRFYRELNLVKNEDRNKMYSTENVGWTTFNYPISEDITYLMKSNFGYGRRSFHFINLSYKGIDILPYSALVKYYYVNMAEFYRFTRQYSPSRDNWGTAFDFVVETANLAIQDEQTFITKWITNELNEMVAGLKIISQQPDECLNGFFDNPKNTNLLYVRNAYSSDRNEYIAFPSEISTIFKAEKLSAALDLLDKLQLLASAHPAALDAIEQIKTLNIKFFPTLKEHINRIEQEIITRQEILASKIAERDVLKDKGKPHYDKIDELIENARTNNQYNIADIRNNYLLSHPEFKQLYDNIQKQSEEISRDEYQISMREKFVERLSVCKYLIINKLDVAA